MLPKDTFLLSLKNSLVANDFVRLTLGKPSSKQQNLKKVLVKYVALKKGDALSFTLREATRDITQNFSLDEGIEAISQFLEQTFLSATLFTIEKDEILTTNKKGKTTLRVQKPTFTTLPTRNHDKDKNRLIRHTSYLQALGIFNQRGQIQKDKGDKYKQINKFVEIIANLVKHNKGLLSKDIIKVVDMGAGKGYLTFALYDYLVNQLRKQALVTGVEIRPDLIKKCNNIAQKVGFEKLHFEEGFISDYDLPPTDMLIALHACDTATDDAIYKGIQANAHLIICAPCCHKQIRRQIQFSQHLQPVIDHGILLERQAEMVTDTIRALLLEWSGYRTKVFEFISTEHTGKNVMIVGQKHQGTIDQPAIVQKINGLKTEFGIDFHYLERLLLIENSSVAS